MERNWWPVIEPADDEIHWPANAPRNQTLPAFIQMYGTQGFLPCESGELENGIVKIAIYIEPKEELVEHAAVQLPNGKWASKMGELEDIIHEAEALEGPPHHYRCAAYVSCPVNKVPRKLRALLSQYGELAS